MAEVRHDVKTMDPQALLKGAGVDFSSKKVDASSSRLKEGDASFKNALKEVEETPKISHLFKKSDASSSLHMRDTSEASKTFSFDVSPETSGLKKKSGEDKLMLLENPFVTEEQDVATPVENDCLESATKNKGSEPVKQDIPGQKKVRSEFPELEITTPLQEESSASLPKTNPPKMSFDEPVQADASFPYDVADKGLSITDNINVVLSEESESQKPQKDPDSSAAIPVQIPLIAPLNLREALSQQDHVTTSSQEGIYGVEGGKPQQSAQSTPGHVLAQQPKDQQTSTVQQIYHHVEHVLSREVLRAHMEELLREQSQTIKAHGESNGEALPVSSVVVKEGDSPKPTAPLVAPPILSFMDDEGSHEHGDGVSSIEFVLDDAEGNPLSQQTQTLLAQSVDKGMSVSEPKLPTTFEKIENQIKSPLEAAIKARNNTIEISLEPEGMGHVRIELNFEGKKVSAHFEAKDPAALSFLKHHEGRIQEIFAASGFSSEQNSLSFSLNQNPHQQKQQGYDNKHAAYKNVSKVLETQGHRAGTDYNNQDGTFAVEV